MTIRLYKSYTPGTRTYPYRLSLKLQKLNQKELYLEKIIVIKDEIIEEL